ncbi:hypothetical protein HPB50_027574 [Hyalomma asiaticum]|uniref:Uncharacterized protein n=1 Tax=Hyalomma asiaticum TaxID=266040 RepID=A0ACB7T2Q5_HYAAI|nr:hypothetical protein HPB50_027574 [Hyalomma asiaticum]
MAVCTLLFRSYNKLNCSNSWQTLQHLITRSYAKKASAAAAAYPSWLWELPLNGPPPLSEMDPETPEYWEVLHRRALLNQNRLLSKAPKVKLRINEKDKLRKLKALRFRALAAYHYDPGVPLREFEEQLKRNRLDW